MLVRLQVMPCGFASASPTMMQETARARIPHARDGTQSACMVSTTRMKIFRVSMNVLRGLSVIRARRRKQDGDLPLADFMVALEISVWY